MLTPEELKAIRERCEAARPGPWSVSSLGRDVLATHVTKGPRMMRVRRPILRTFSNPINKSDVEFAAHARSDIPALLAHAKAQDAIIQQLRERLDRAKRG